MTRYQLILRFSILCTISLLISACTDGLLSTSTRSDRNIPQLNSQTTSADMVAFEGKVFVASTKPETTLWKAAGWQVAGQPFTGDENAVPPDCTLYPHQGVDDQWIGSCSGYTSIPRQGAVHIAVMYTKPDGTTDLVQVAPPPAAGEP
jgi:hypothetical protein